MKKTKIMALAVFSSIVLFALLAPKDKGLLPLSLKKMNTASINNPSKEVEALISKQSSLQERDQKTSVMAAFFNLKLDSLSEETQESLNVLEAAMRSGQKDAVPLIRDLLVDVAYNKVQIDNEYKNQVDRLILIMAKEAPYEIEAMRTANPESVALKYLDTIIKG